MACADFRIIETMNILFELYLNMYMPIEEKVYVV